MGANSYFDLGGGLGAFRQGYIEQQRLERELLNKDIANKMAAQQAAQQGAYYGQPDLLEKHGGRYVPMVTGMGMVAPYQLDPTYQGAPPLPPQGSSQYPASQAIGPIQSSGGLMRYEPEPALMYLDPRYTEPNRGERLEGVDNNRRPAAQTVAPQGKKQAENQASMQDLLGKEIQMIDAQLGQMQGAQPSPLQAQRQGMEYMAQMYPGGVNQNGGVVDPYLAQRGEELQNLAAKKEMALRQRRDSLMQAMMLANMQKSTPDINNQYRPPGGSGKGTKTPSDPMIKVWQDEYKQITQALIKPDVKAALMGLGMTPELAMARKAELEQKIRGASNSTAESTPKSTTNQSTETGKTLSMQDATAMAAQGKGRILRRKNGTTVFKDASGKIQDVR